MTTEGEQQYEMFEHPDALKQSLIFSFYTNSSKYDLRRIRQLINIMERQIEIDPNPALEVLLA